MQGAGEKAFCAGGDIRQLTETRQGRPGARRRWPSGARNTSSTSRIKRYPKPYISLIDGIVMGGGVGVSLHGAYRVAGERYLFAMPEVGIGFFPDVGATYALPRLPGETGMYLALTGERVKRADARHARPGDPCGARARASRRLREALMAGEPVDAALARFAADPGPAPLDG